MPIKFNKKPEAKTSAGVDAVAYPVKWTDIPKGSLCEALVDGRPTLVVRWTEAAIGGAAMIPSASGGPVFPLHVTNSRQGPVRVLVDGLSDEHCSVVARLSGGVAKAAAHLLQLVRLTVSTVYIGAEPIGTVGVRYDNSPQCSQVFVKVGTNDIQYIDAHGLHEWVGVGYVRCKIVLAGLTPAQCEKLIATKYEDLPDALTRLAAEVEAAKRPAYKVGDKVRWSDMRPGSVFRDADGCEYMHLQPTDNADCDLVMLASGHTSKYCLYDDPSDEYSYTVLAVDLSDAVCGELSTLAGEEDVCLRWQLMAGSYVPLREVPTGRVVVRPDGTWIVKLSSGRCVDEEGDDVSETELLVNSCEMTLSDDDLRGILRSENPEAAYIERIRREKLLVTSELSEAGRHAVIAHFADASRAWTVDVLEYPRVRAAALAAAQTFIDCHNSRGLRRFGVYARQMADGRWWGWWGTLPRRAASPEELLLMYYRDWPTEFEMLTALLGGEDAATAAGVDLEDGAPLLLDDDTHVSIGRLLGSPLRLRACTSMLCVSNDDVEVRLSMSTAAMRDVPIDGPTLVSRNLASKVQDRLVVWDFAGDPARAKLLATLASLEPGVAEWCRRTEMIYLDMSPQPCED